MRRKSRQNAENKKTCDLTRKNENEKRKNQKTRQNAENKQTCDFFSGKIEIDKKISSKL